MFNSLLERSMEWMVLVGTITAYLYARATHLTRWERLGATMVSPLLAVALTDTVAPYLNDNDMAATIAIMLCGPFLLGVFLSVTQEEEFVKSTFQEWVRMRVGLPAQRQSARQKAIEEAEDQNAQDTSED